MIKYIYTFFLGLLLALFVGVGIATFYTAPKAPDYWAYNTQPATAQPTAEEKAKATADQQIVDTYNQEMRVYNRNVSAIALTIAIVLLVISLLTTHRLLILADGMLLGGVFTLVYSMGRGLASEDVQYRFIVTSVGLLVALVLGYLKFIRAKSE